MQNVAEAVEPAGAGDQVEQVAMLPRLEVGLMCNCT